MHLKHFFQHNFIFENFIFENFIFRNFFKFYLILFKFKFFFSKKFAMNSVHEPGSRTMSKNLTQEKYRVKSGKKQAEYTECTTLSQAAHPALRPRAPRAPAARAYRAAAACPARPAWGLLRLPRAPATPAACSPPRRARACCAPNSPAACPSACLWAPRAPYEPNRAPSYLARAV